MIFFLFSLAISANQLDESSKAQLIPHDDIFSTYINKNFTGTFPVHSDNQIQLGNTEIKQISGCRFTDLTTPKIFFIKVNAASSIFDNIFERTKYETGKAGCIWYAFSSETKFVISNCKFHNMVGKGDDASILNVNAQTVANIEFRDCEFIDCGEKGNDRPLVNALQKDNRIEFYNCHFSYADPQKSRVLELKGNGAIFDNCYFDKCGENSIDIGIADITGNTDREFKFTNNYVRSINTRFIRAPRIRSSVTIHNNTFEECTIENKYFISITHNQDIIEFSNNTFNNIKSLGNTESECGGLGIFIHRTDGNFKIKYENCHFSNIINEHTNHPSNQGGVLQYFNDNTYSIDIEIIKCSFKNNKTPHHGGAISIRTSGKVLIDGCQFEANEANSPTISTSNLLFNNYYDQKTHGFGGAIYLNPTYTLNNNNYEMNEININGCTFNNNRAYQGYAIYIEGEEYSNTFKIESNTFTNNHETTGSPTTNGIIASEILTLSKDTIENSNTFTITEESTNSEKVSHVDHEGNRLPDPTQSPTQSPTPQRTPHSGSADTYINKNFTGTIPVHSDNQIQLGDGDIKQISGCRFTDLSMTKIFFIKVKSASSIFDNIFERTKYETGKAGCIWYAFSSETKFVISNCKFHNIPGKDADASILNVNAQTVANIEFRDCEFIDCGEKGNDRPLVNALQNDNRIEFYNCHFSYADPQKSRVLELKGNGAIFDNCYFDKCGENSIDIGIADITDNTDREFKFINNYVRSINTRFIRAPRIRSSVTIHNNTFEECTIENKYFISITHNQDIIEFSNNTFNNIKSLGNTESECGGLGIFIHRTDGNFKIKYENCHFSNIINEHTNHPSNQGGVLQYFNNNTYSIDIEIIKCSFKNNKTPHHGGAISIRTSGKVLIDGCQFENNEANSPTISTSNLLFNNYYDQKTHGFGGAIYLNPTYTLNNNNYEMNEININGCTFNNNRAYQGYAIYIEGEKYSNAFKIESNTFTNNHETTGSPTTNGIIASEILTLSKDTIENTNTFTITEESTNSEKISHVDHEGNRLPDPTQSPTPQRTPHSGSADTYINKNFTGTIPVSLNNQIQLGDTDIKQISGCRFTDLSMTNRVFFIKVNAASSIFDNIFEQTKYETGKAGCIWYAFSSETKFVISNCKFYNIPGKDGDASILNVNAQTVANIEFRDCEFIDCGEKGNDRPLVNALQNDNRIEFYNCHFSYADPQKSRVLELKGNGAIFDNCYFDKCGENSIDIGIADITGNTDREFKFTNNYVRSINTRFIRAPRIRSSVIIHNNTFEECTIENKYFISITHNQDIIEFSNNTFNNIKSLGNTESECGGLGIFIHRTDGNFKIKYENCHFSNIINEHTNHPSNQGGVLQYFNNNTYSIDIEIIKCSFKNNKTPHHGGAISIRTSGKVLIDGCQFEANEANSPTISTSNLLFNNYYDQKTHGFGGAIYLNPTYTLNNNNYEMSEININGCTFNNNRAYQGYAIYIEGEKYANTFKIESNTFTNNHETAGSPTTNGIIASEILTLSKDTIENTNIFTITEESTNSEKFMRVDHKGNLLPEGEFVIGDENYTQTKPTDRIEKELDIHSTSDVNAKVTVVVSEISTKTNDDGGAIHIVNCALDCTGTKFDTCVSNKGGGGGIYIKNYGGKKNDVNLVGLNFNKCSAEYGGAIYVYSSIDECNVFIKKCNFENNVATIAESEDNKNTGGSSIYMNSKRGIIILCKFKDKQSSGSTVKILNDFDESSSSSSRNLLNFISQSKSNQPFVVSDCSFEIGKNSMRSIYYDQRNNGPKLNIVNTNFSGNLINGAHYIDGKRSNKLNSYLILAESCRFSDNSSKDVKEFVNNEFVRLGSNNLFSNSKGKENRCNVSFGLIVPIAAVILIVIIVIAAMNRNRQRSISDDVDDDEIQQISI